jgi:hypothetical protein
MEINRKKLDELYKEWSGEHHTTNSNKKVHDSAECTDFAEYCLKYILSKREKSDLKEQILSKYENYVSLTQPHNRIPIFLKENVLEAMDEYANEMLSARSEQLICPACGCNKILMAETTYVCRNKDCEHHWAN